MPKNWDDHDAWEAYYAALPSDAHWYKIAVEATGSFPLARIGSLVEDLRSHACSTLWFPGCGYSPLPRAFASYGFTVYATDIASSAVEYQSSNEAIVRSQFAESGVESENRRSGCVKPQMHDFRTSFGDRVVDAIFNIKSFQGLSPRSMALASQTHFAALRPGGVAVFDTINVQGERRDQLEQSLADAGFYVPIHALNKWYRSALAETGVPYMLVLGSPLIPQRDDYPYPHKRGSAEYQRDVDILRAITAEYRSRADAVFAEEQKAVGNETKHARVIYSTG